MRACDPVFVNPNSFDSMKEVLRRVGKAANVKRYHPNKEDARHWLSLTMDGLPYLVVRGIIDEVHICAQCEKEVIKSDFSSHDLVNHKGQIIEYVREFDWVVLRIGKLHVEMNMAKTLVNVTWEVFFSQMASEMGFKTEAAQKFAHKCSDHHKTASLIEIAHVGIWSELLVPYVKARLEAGERLSVNDYLYAWIPDNAFKCPRYRFMFLMAWKFFSAFKIFHIGVRRNNARYVHAGQMAFSSLFHRSSASKYALIDLYDR
ncbi:uncharacterized protein LOC114574605 [Exaiptasia diaphana]|uniref:Uncharacterized protein n=1 Tax=Exaiptasia diaphana TaxID=2652724 RepID=A0A913YER2_EXADI|nr:uncharacterized protein LOC114574605 [Exaiptasia diaphana]